jgi:formylglycine-generating enzyme required for sulfatase activity/serine/threonine protein kinase
MSSNTPIGSSLPADSDPALPVTAETVYREYLEQRDRGDGLDFDEYCARHPRLGGALRLLHSLRGDEVGLAPGTDAAPSTLGERREDSARGAAFEWTTGRIRDIEAEPRETAEPLDSTPFALEVKETDRYEVGEEIARGGMGRILRAWDRPLRRSLAMKVLLGGVGSGGPNNDPVLARFLDEARITGQLDHPGVVPVHDLGVDAEGRSYFTMRLVEGRDLSAIVRLVREGKEGWTLTRAIGVLVRVCEAVAYAHSKGVIHRDLKPANVMVGRFGETYVMDWGLAKTFESTTAAPGASAARPARETVDPLFLRSARTLDGSVFGTPVYMPPEQAEGRVDEIDARSDVYALGSMLYELLAGYPPYVTVGLRATPLEILGAVRSGPPVALESIARGLPAELVAIAEKAMARAKEARYETVAAMAEDLRAYIEDRVVRAHRTGAVIEFRKWVRRNRATAAALAGLILVVIASLGGIAWLESRSRREIVLRTDVYLQSGLEKEAEFELWPALPGSVPAMERWLERATELVSRASIHRARLAELRAKSLPRTDDDIERDRTAHPRYREWLVRTATTLEDRGADAGAADTNPDADPEPDESEDEPRGVSSAITDSLPTLSSERRDELQRLESEISERRTWTFSSASDQLEHDALAGLVAGLDRFLASGTGTIEALRARLDRARTARARSIDAHAGAWERAIRAIREGLGKRLYRGLEIRPQVGLVPLEADPLSGLEEFALIDTGEIPTRDADRRLDIDENSALVFVLVPGGTFAMGAVRGSDPSPEGAPNVDRWSTLSEGPVHTVSLEPYFLSKYEMTQGQWLRVTRMNPSAFAPPRKLYARSFSLADPVEQVSWVTCRDVLARLGLELPTEAQWEYAARAGTSTVWSTGNDRETLRGAVNVADRAAARAKLTWPAIDDWPILDDGHAVHAPVGTYRANPFGFSELHGNVWEWCRDTFDRRAYSAPTSPIDGEHLVEPGLYLVVRGGSYYTTVTSTRCAARGFRGPRVEDAEIGVRPALRFAP